MKPIKTDSQYEKALGELERLVAKDPEPGTPAADKLEVLTVLVESYEKDHFPIERPDPVEAIRFRMEQQGLKSRDLMPYIGSRSKVSEVLGRRRPLTLRMIRALHKGLGIPAEVLLQEPTKKLPEEIDIDWDRFPLKEMVKRKWISVSLKSIEDRAEEVMREFISPLETQELLSALYRKTVFKERSGAAMDPYALVAWTARILLLAREQSPPRFEPGRVTLELMREVARCSWSAQGPLLAQEFLFDRGILLIVEPHLPRTYLDGSAILTKKGNPVVGLTIRHDRIDNFWFVLLHELAHVAKHLSAGTSFYDDLDSVPQDETEKEADEMAQNALIPLEAWERFISHEPTPGRIRELAQKLTIHPAIVAGRVRHAKKNFRLFAKMVGTGQVRPLFVNARPGTQAKPWRS